MRDVRPEGCLNTDGRPTGGWPTERASVEALPLACRRDGARCCWVTDGLDFVCALLSGMFTRPTWRTVAFAVVYCMACQAKLTLVMLERSVVGIMPPIWPTGLIKRAWWQTRSGLSPVSPRSLPRQPGDQDRTALGAPWRGMFDQPAPVTVQGRRPRPSILGVPKGPPAPRSVVGHFPMSSR